MAGIFKPGFYSHIKTSSASEAETFLTDLFGDGIRLLPSDNVFEMECLCAAFERSTFLLWSQKTEVEIAVPFEHYLVCTSLVSRVAIQDGGKAIELDGGAVAFMQPSRQRSFRWSAGATLASIAISPSEFRRLMPAWAPSVLANQYRLFDREVYPGSVFSELIEFLVANYHNGRPEPGKASARHLFDHLITFSVQRLFEDEGARAERVVQSGLVPKHVKIAEDYIRLHLSEPLDSEILASIANVSPRSIHRGFVTFRGVTPARFVQALRLDTAHKVLTEGGDARDIQHVAASIGFKSYPVFWRSYVRKFGMAPSKMRGLPKGSNPDTK
jgi:AraC-like DNA-binding protein